MLEHEEKKEQAVLNRKSYFDEISLYCSAERSIVTSQKSKVEISVA